MNILLFFLLGFIIGSLSVIALLYFNVTEKREIIILPKLKDEKKN